MLFKRRWSENNFVVVVAKAFVNNSGPVYPESVFEKIKNGYTRCETPFYPLF